MNDRMLIPRELVIAIAADVAWYDTITLPRWADGLPMFDRMRELGAPLKPDEFVDCDVADIPAEVWAAHRLDYGNPQGHGLKLADAPSIVGVIRNSRGELGLLIGYQAKEST